MLLTHGLAELYTPASLTTSRALINKIAYEQNGTGYD